MKLPAYRQNQIYGNGHAKENRRKKKKVSILKKILKKNNKKYNKHINRKENRTRKRTETQKKKKTQEINRVEIRKKVADIRPCQDSNLESPDP